MIGVTSQCLFCLRMTGDRCCAGLRRATWDGDEYVHMV